MSEAIPTKALDFVELMTEFQGRLFGYIMTLTGDPDAANDILQEANVVLWKQSQQFELGTNFKAWAFRIAHFQFMAYRQRRLREKVLYSDDLLATLSALDRPAGMVRSANRVWLTRVVADEPSAQGG